jgi:type II secretory pathway component PulF
MLTRVSEAYDEEVELSAQKVTSMIEPLLIVSMSIVVGFIVVAILLPILQIGQMASRR